ncbi:hypothetical protein ACQP2U_15020 [Nocardia sp. CA-084685]|uniref:hypothetical protein n=1 Tax=Nocardia sp. CA-084685 TaxID=3239970 RepID=UPI003D98AD2D
MSPPEFIAAAELDTARAHLGLGDLEAAGARITRFLELPGNCAQHRLSNAC